MATLCNTMDDIREAYDHLVEINRIRLQCLAIGEVDLANQASDTMLKSINNQPELWLTWREMLRKDSRSASYYVGCLLDEAMYA